MFIDSKLTAVLDDFLWQLVSIRNKLRLTEPIQGNIAVTIDFYMTKNPDDQDADNMGTTLLDLLQKGRIIQNDKYVYDFHVRKFFSPGNSPSMTVQIKSI